MTTRVFTIGHGARTLETFVDLLRRAGVERIADIRTAPGSRKHPHFNRDALAASLPDRGIAYEWWGEDLGGFRRARPDSRHVELRTGGFRGYADHMETDAFRDARGRLIEAATGRSTAVMCAESVWSPAADIRKLSPFTPQRAGGAGRRPPRERRRRAGRPRSSPHPSAGACRA